MSDIAYYHPVAPESGTLRVPRDRAMAVARALLVGTHPWVRSWASAHGEPYRGPTAIPAATLDEWEGEAREGCSCKDCGGDEDGRIQGPCFRPDAKLVDGVVTWRPWGYRDSEGRRTVTVDTTTGEIRWKAAKRSTFIGGLLVAAAGGLSATPCRMEPVRGAA